jgi:hypothetical protein
MSSEHTEDRVAGPIDMDLDEFVAGATGESILGTHPERAANGRSASVPAISAGSQTGEAASLRNDPVPAIIAEIQAGEAAFLRNDPVPAIIAGSQKGEVASVRNSPVPATVAGSQVATALSGEATSAPAGFLVKTTEPPRLKTLDIRDIVTFKQKSRPIL